MSTCSYPTIITASGTLSLYDNVIIVSNSTAITLTLPDLTAPNILPDGVFYQITKNSTASGSDITITTTTLIYVDNITTTTSLVITAVSYIELITRNGNWYLLKNVLRNSSSILGIVSTVFVANNSTPNLPLTGNLTADILYSCIVNSITPIPKTATFVFRWSAGTVSGVINLYRYDTSTNTSTLFFTSSTFSVPSSPVVTTITFTITSFPSLSTLQSLRVQFVGSSGSADKCGLCSIQIT